MVKCPNCGKKFVKYPIRDDEGKLIVRNLFKMDFFSVLFVVCIILMVIGYKADIAKCDEVIEDPCGFCEKSGCYEYLEQQKWIQPQIEPELEEWPTEIPR